MVNTVYVSYMSFLVCFEKPLTDLIVVHWISCLLIDKMLDQGTLGDNDSSIHIMIKRIISSVSTNSLKLIRIQLLSFDTTTKHVYANQLRVINADILIIDQLYIR